MIKHERVQTSVAFRLFSKALGGSYQKSNDCQSQMLSLLLPRPLGPRVFLAHATLDCSCVTFLAVTSALCDFYTSIGQDVSLYSLQNVNFFVVPALWTFPHPLFQCLLLLVLDTVFATSHEINEGKQDSRPRPEPLSEPIAPGQQILRLDAHHQPVSLGTSSILLPNPGRTMQDDSIEAWNLSLLNLQGPVARTSQQ